MSHARAVIAAVLATGLVVLILVDEVQSPPGTPSEMEPAFLLLAVAIIVLVVPDAITYFRKNKEDE